MASAPSPPFVASPRSPGLRVREALAVAPLAIALIAGYLYFAPLRPAVDEVYHFDQIGRFLDGKRGLSPDVTTPPVFHYVLSIVGKATGFRSLSAMRLLILILAGASIFVFWRLARQWHPSSAAERTAQYALLPIVFPFFLLLYTDVPSLLFLILAIFLLANRHYAASACSALACMVIRQNAIVWFTFVFVLFLTDRVATNGEDALPTGTRSAIAGAIRKSRQNLLSFSIFLLGFAGFGVFLIVNKGIAVGDASAHPFPTLHLGNVFFCLFLFFVLFLPFCIAAAPRMWAMAVSHWRLASVALGALLMIYLRTFAADHVYNRYDPAGVPHFIRNVVLQWGTASIGHKLLFFLPIAYASGALAATPLCRTSWYSLYPFGFVYLAPAWLIEERYDIVPFTLFLLFRGPASRRVELASVGYEAILTVLVLVGIHGGNVFL
jgi:alpha-1,2-glucosyltransferase